MSSIECRLLSADDSDLIFLKFKSILGFNNKEKL